MGLGGNTFFVGRQLIKSVVDFGANPAATPDQNKSAFQNAINQAVSEGFTHVYLHPGTYTIRNTLSIPDGFKFNGENAAAKLVDADGTQTGTLTVTDFFVEGGADPSTGLTATAADLLKDKTAAVNGQVIVGTLVPGSDPSAGVTATAGDVRAGKTFAANGQVVTGTKPVQTTTLVTSNQTLPAGIYDSSVVVNVSGFYPTPGTNNVYLVSGQSSTSNTTAAKMYSCVVQVAGKYRLSIDVATSAPSATMNVTNEFTFRKNGVIIGSTRSTNSSSFVTLTYDMLDANAASVGDTIEVWGRSSSSSYTAFYKNFSLGIAQSTNFITAT